MTVNTRSPPSVTEVSAIEMVALSLSRMVPVATELPSTGATSSPCGLDSVTVTVSSISSMASPTVPTVMVWLVEPAAKVTVPLVRPLMSPDSALPSVTA